jgi:hypothetical protein
MLEAVGLAHAVRLLEGAAQTSKGPDQGPLFAGFF